MNKDIKERWIKALRSGEYKQGIYVLKNGDTYCCLGVLCDLYSKETKKANFEMIGGRGNLFLGHLSVLPQEVVDWANFNDQEGEISLNGKEATLTGINDNGATFEEIADIIEEQF